jgi:pyrroline-5-carboxylate reductase
MKVTIIGLGRIGRALQAGFRSDARVTSIEGTRSGHDNIRAIDAADVIVLAVKPHHARSVALEIAEHVESALVVSICAGIRIDDLSAWLQGYRRIVRAMPNTPALIGAATTVLTGAPDLATADLDLARSLFANVGHTEVLDEGLFDAVTALSGCGPAWAFSVIAALADGGAALGIPHDAATRLAAYTLLGSAKMLLERGVHPAELRDEVATPGGATVAGLHVLEAADVHRTFAETLAASARRAAELRGA